MIGNLLQTRSAAAAKSTISVFLSNCLWDKLGVMYTCFHNIYHISVILNLPHKRAGQLSSWEYQLNNVDGIPSLQFFHAFYERLSSNGKTGLDYRGRFVSPLVL
jgi:hypothetical protein